MNKVLISGVAIAALSVLSASAWAQGTVVTDDKTNTTVSAPANGKTTVRTAPNGDTVITVTVDDKPVPFEPSAAPRMIGGRVMVPLRGVVEKLGGEIQYEPSSKVITGAHKTTQNQFRLRLGSDGALLNGQEMNLDAPPRVIGGVTYVPLRFVSEAMGAEVYWDNAKHTVVIEAAGHTAEVKPN